MSGGRQRLDRLLAARGLAPSRARAADLIRRGKVRVAGHTITKPGAQVPEDAPIEVAEDGPAWVSRAAWKLLAAIDADAALKSAIEGAVALDIGASTGGFVQVLLAHGARRVHAVDVGRGQLHETLRRDPRVVVLEGVNARHLDAALIPEPPQVITADVSFISLKKALPAALALAAPGAMAAVLVKPQFEAGPQHVGKGGIVRDERVRERVLADIAAWFEQQGWQVRHTLPSPITGADGNREYLLTARRAP